MTITADNITDLLAYHYDTSGVAAGDFLKLSNAVKALGAEALFTFGAERMTVFTDGPARCMLDDLCGGFGASPITEPF